jgi:NADPH:quinone reductase-like Zn-dependent oxidoreductase
MSRSVSFAEFGPASVLRIDDVPEPHAAAGQVRVKVVAAALNPMDSKVRSGMLKDWIPIVPPSTMGNEFSGVVDEVGGGVTDLAIGDEVFGSKSFGALADYVVVDAASLARKPANVDWDVAAGIQVAGSTAYNSVNALNLGPDDTVLVSAAAGGVGAIAAQLARNTGATVLGTASEANHEYLRSLGVIPLSYGPELADRVREVAPQGITAVLENHSDEALKVGAEFGVPGAKMNTIAGDGSAFGARNAGGTQDAETLTAVAALVSSGELEIPIEAVFPVAEIVEAYERLDAGHLRGKIVARF